MKPKIAEAKEKLYGIHHSNRPGAQLWGKNQFNSTFPTALACYMRDKAIPPVYLTLDDNLAVTASDLSVDEVFNSNLPNSELQFDFEHKYQPYQRHHPAGTTLERAI